MPSGAEFGRGALGGAGVGFSFGGPVGAGIGAVVGVISSLFGGDDDDELEAITERINKRRRETLRAGFDIISKETQKQIGRVNRSAVKASAAGGGAVSSQALALPGIGKVTENTGTNLERFLTETNRSFDNQITNLEAQNATQEPNFLDYALEFGGQIAKMKLNTDYINALTPGSLNTPVEPPWGWGSGPGGGGE